MLRRGLRYSSSSGSSRQAGRRFPLFGLQVCSIRRALSVGLYLHYFHARNTSILSCLVSALSGRHALPCALLTLFGFPSHEVYTGSKVLLYIYFSRPQYLLSFLSLLHASGARTSLTAATAMRTTYGSKIPQTKPCGRPAHSATVLLLLPVLSVCLSTEEEHRRDTTSVKSISNPATFTRGMLFCNAHLRCIIYYKTSTINVEYLPTMLTAVGSQTVHRV